MVLVNLSYLGVMGLLTNIIVLQAIHSGQASQLPSLLVGQVKQLTGFAVVMSLFERLVALLLQVLLTAWDFLAVTKHKLSFYFVAILLHAAIDFLAGAYQLGIVSNLLLIRLILAIYVLGVGLLTRKIWRRRNSWDYQKHLKHLCPCEERNFRLSKVWTQVCW